MDPDEVVEIIDEIGTRLTPVGEKAYELVQRQVIIDAWVMVFNNVMLLVLILISTIVAVSALRRDLRLEKADPTNYRTTDLTMTFILGGFLVAGVALLVLVVGLATSAGDIATKLFNPEWAAIERIFEAINPPASR